MNRAFFLEEMKVYSSLLIKNYGSGHKSGGFF